MNQPEYLPDFFASHNLMEIKRGQSLTNDLILFVGIRGSGVNSFYVFGVRYWNTLATSIRCHPTLSHFKSV